MQPGTFRPRDSYAKGATTHPLIDQTIGANFSSTVARFAEHEALVERSSGRRWTYAEFDAEVDAVALGLLALGVTTGDRVGIWAPNCAEWVLVQYATAKIGALLVNINPAYRTHELAFVAKQSGLRTLVAVSEFKGSSYADMIDAIRHDCPALHDVVLIGAESWNDLMRAGRHGDPAQLDAIGGGLEPDDPINIQYT